MSSAFSEKTRDWVKSRAEGRCELCGGPMIVGHFHHRRARGMGGTKRDTSGAASNCLLIHPSCHADVESHRQRALDNGWLLRQTEDPLVVPVKLWSGMWLLDDSGEYVPVS